MAWLKGIHLHATLPAKAKHNVKVVAVAVLDSKAVRQESEIEFSTFQRAPDTGEKFE